MSFNENSWPPAFTVRKSRRARRVSLRVSRERGLEVVVPERGRMPDVLAVLETHKKWVLGRLGKREEFLHSRNSLQGENPFEEANPGFFLHGGDLRVQLDISSGRSWGGAYWLELFAVTPMGGEVVWPLSGGTPQQLSERLSLCIKSYARHYLAKRLDELSRSSGLGYGRFSLGKQRSRWGSFSTSGLLRLNCNLVFIPHELSDYVILHELCHSVHHNHSSRFWSLMQEKDPLSLKKNKDLLEAGIWVPSWFI